MVFAVTQLALPDHPCAAAFQAAVIEVSWHLKILIRSKKEVVIQGGPTCPRTNCPFPVHNLFVQTNMPAGWFRTAFLEKRHVVVVVVVVVLVVLAFSVSSFSGMLSRSQTLSLFAPNLAYHVSLLPSCNP